MRFTLSEVFRKVGVLGTSVPFLVRPIPLLEKRPASSGECHETWRFLKWGSFGRDNIWDTIGSIPYSTRLRSGVHDLGKGRAQFQKSEATQPSTAMVPEKARFSRKYFINVLVFRVPKQYQNSSGRSIIYTILFPIDSGIKDPTLSFAPLLVLPVRYVIVM